MMTEWGELFQFCRNYPEFNLCLISFSEGILKSHPVRQGQVAARAKAENGERARGSYPPLTILLVITHL